MMLGIEIDTASQTARLPEDKFSAIWQLLIQWRQKKWCKKRELQSLIGHLHHACKVVWPGRTFLRRMIDLLCCFRKHDHPIRLNAEFAKDLDWRFQFFARWNGVSIFMVPGLEPPPRPTLRLPQTLQERWAMARTGGTSGSMANGQQTRISARLPLKNCSR